MNTKRLFYYKHNIRISRFKCYVLCISPTRKVSLIYSPMGKVTPCISLMGRVTKKIDHQQSCYNLPLPP